MALTGTPECAASVVDSASEWRVSLRGAGGCALLFHDSTDEFLLSTAELLSANIRHSIP
jgi:hypothetical protein